MKRTTSLAIMLLVFAFCMAPLFASAQQTRNIDDRIKTLDELLDLTDEQEKSIREILERPRENRIPDNSSRNERSGNRDAPPQGNRTDRRPMMGGMRMQGEGPIMEILTEEQQQKYREHQKEQMITRRIEFMDQKLDLSDKQKEELEAVFREEAEKGREFRENDKRPSRAERREAMKKIRERQKETQKKIGSILTKEQSKQYEEMIKNMRNRRRPQR